MHRKTPFYKALERDDKHNMQLALTRNPHAAVEASILVKAFKRHDLEFDPEKITLNVSTLLGVVFKAITQDSLDDALKTIDLLACIEQQEEKQEAKQEGRQEPKQEKHLISKEAIQGFIELAASLNKPKLVHALIGIYPKPRRHEIIRTAAYWAAVNNDQSCFEFLCPTNEDRALTLWQLNQDNRAEFSKYYKLADLKVREMCDNYLGYNLIPLDSRTLDSKYANEYAAAVRNKVKSLTHLPINYQTAIGQHGCKVSNFVALHTLHQALGIEKVKKTFLDLRREDNAGVYDFHIFALGIDLPEFWQSRKNDQTFTESVIKHIGSKAYWYHFLSRNRNGFISDAEQDFFIKTPKTDMVIFDAILDCVRDKSDDPDLDLINLNTIETSVSNKLTTADKLKKETQFELDRLFRLFSLPIRCQQEKEQKISFLAPGEQAKTHPELPHSIWNTIFKFLTAKEKAYSVNADRNLYLRAKNHYSEEKINAEIENLIAQLQKSRDKRDKVSRDLVTLQQFKSELEAKDCLMPQVNFGDAVGFILLTGITIGNADCLYKLIQNQVSGKDDSISIPFIVFSALSFLFILYGSYFNAVNIRNQSYRINSEAPLSRSSKSIRDSIEEIKSIVSPWHLSLATPKPAALRVVDYSIRNLASIDAEQIANQEQKKLNGLLSIYQNQRLFKIAPELAGKTESKRNQNDDVAIDVAKVPNLQGTNPSASLLVDFYEEQKAFTHYRTM